MGCILGIFFGVLLPIFGNLIGLHLVWWVQLILVVAIWTAIWHAGRPLAGSFDMVPPIMLFLFLGGIAIGNITYLHQHSDILAQFGHAVVRTITR